MPRSSSEGDHTAIIYNFLTDTEQLEYYSVPSVQSQTIIHSSLGTHHKDNEALNPSSVFGSDGRVKITSTSSFPWSAICKIEVSVGLDGWMASGVMIYAYHVLTCAHIVYHHEKGGWVDEVVVIPGMRGDTKPFGKAYATEVRTYTEWTEYELEAYDLAVITLDRTIGNKTGWLGRMTANYTDPVYTGTLHTAGYPGDLNDGEYMYYTSDQGEVASEYNHWYWLDTAGGQSGSPVWHEVDGEAYILSVHAYHYYGEYANFGTRLNQDKFDDITTWLASDTPPTPKPDEIDPVIIVLVVVAVSAVVVVVAPSIRNVLTKRHINVRKSHRMDSIYEDSGRIKTPLVQTEPLFYCPMCGKGVFRGKARFCVSCGYSLLTSE